MTTVVGISGSLRAGSFNSALLRAAQGEMPAGATLEIATIEGVPLYNADLETAQGLPSAVTALKERIVAADALLLATPEYNNSIPGVFKNAIDWLSRPPADLPRIFRGRPVAIIGASPSGFGTLLSQTAWLPVLKTLGTDAWFGGRVLVSRANGAFDATGTLVDAGVREQLKTFLAGFCAFVAAGRRGKP
jgi:NAD(P)H-dependent FMN reductase